MSFRDRIRVTVDSEESIHRTDFYKILTDQRTVPFGIVTTRIDSWSEEATVQDMDLLYGFVQLCEKRHGNHYSGDFERISAAYEKADFEGFIRSINDLLVSIIND